MRILRARVLGVMRKPKYQTSMKNLTRITLIFTFMVLSPMAKADEEQTKETTMSVTGKNVPAGRMLIDKKYSGGLVGSGLGQMISKRTKTGSAVYSAIEEFEGSLDGKKGAFTLVHYGEMSAEGQKLNVNIVAGSGSGELENISGSLEIIQEDKTHKYVLNYKL